MVGSGKILMLGNDYVGMNYAANTYHFRQDSSFLYFFGIDRPSLAAVMDLDKGETILFGDELTMDDIVWTGPLPSLRDQASAVGVTKVEPTYRLEEFLKGSSKIHFLPPYRDRNILKLHRLLKIPVDKVKNRASMALIRGVIALRESKSSEEIAAIEEAVQITNQLHLTAMLTARPGMTEAQVHAAVEASALSHQCQLSFPAIITVDGQTLHNHSHHNRMREGQLLLVDAGAEGRSHYAGDMTRTFPVGARFDSRQRDVYQVVLNAQAAAIAALRPGIAYKTCHLKAATVVAEGMKSLGLLKGNTEDIVTAGAHAMFFQHGLGHMMGLDVHDMEDLGENNVGYGGRFKRSDQFGLGFLRLAKPLKPGFVVTVEPGIYFIPQLIDLWRSEGKFKDFIVYDKLESYKDFGGIRIEDDYLIMEKGARLLGGRVPKTIEEIEAIRGGVV